MSSMDPKAFALPLAQRTKRAKAASAQEYMPRFYRAVNLRTGHEIEARGSWVPIARWGECSDRVMIKSNLIQRHPLAAGLQLRDIEIEFLPQVQDEGLA